MKLTERDLAILQFINQFGFCEIQHIQRRFLLQVSRSYQIMQRLVQADLAKQNRIFFSRPGFYCLTQKGAHYVDSPYSANTSLVNYIHNITVLEVYFQLSQAHTDAHWISERELLHDKCIGGYGRRGHVADGVLVFPDGKKIAVEVELTFKGVYRTEEILKWYCAQFSIEEVWYFCPENILVMMRELVDSMSFIKMHNLTEFLPKTMK